MNLLLLHGAFGSASQLEGLKSALDNVYQVHVVELEGHGQTPSAGADYSMDRFVANVRDSMKSHAIERTAVFGYSMGGYVALKLAADSPELVSSVITLGTKLTWSPQTALHEISRLDPAKIRAKVPSFAVQLSQRHRGVAGGWETVLAKTSALMIELGDRPLVDPELMSRIQQPVRLMVGDRDVIVSVEETAAAVKNFPKGELVVLPNTYHPLEQVRVRLIASLIQDFVGL